MSSRRVILNILTDFDKHPSSLDLLIDHALKASSLDERDRRFVFEIVYGIMRRKATLDYIIDYYLTDEKVREDQLLRRIMRIGMYQLIYLDRVPDHAAVNETVKLAKSNKNTMRLAGTVNAVMRAFIKDKKQIHYPDSQKDLAGRLSIEFSHPLWMVERWLRRFGLGNTRSLLAFNNEKPQIYLRRTLRMISRSLFEADSRSICDPVGGYHDLYYRLKKGLRPEKIQLLKRGFCHVQAPSSGWVVALLEIARGDRIVDICSAPGGKSLLMAELTTEDGAVCACEVNYKRLKKVVETASKMNIRNIYPVLCDGIYPPFLGTFDKVLLDSPCTGTGILHRHPEGRWIKTENDIVKLAEVQKKLLDSAAGLVEKGGIIVYSTCSLEPEENEMQIDRFLKDHSEFRLEDCPQTVPQKFIDNRGFLRITPFEHQMDGMFAARLRRSGH